MSASHADDARVSDAPMSRAAPCSTIFRRDRLLVAAIDHLRRCGARAQAARRRIAEGRAARAPTRCSACSGSFSGTFFQVAMELRIAARTDAGCGAC
jgi:hypothetical protein